MKFLNFNKNNEKFIVWDQTGFERLVFILSLFMIFFGVLARILGFVYNRSLWIDEAYLASSVVQRGYLDLLTPLDFEQGAPIGYLWLVKTFVYIIGSSEYVLRLPSLIAGIASVYAFYRVLRDVFHDSRPYIGTAFFATIPFLIYYSIEFKPYMLDGLLTLISLLLFHKALKQEIKTGLLIIYSSIVVWFSFPAIFTMASFYILWFGWSLWKRNKRNALIALGAGGTTLLSFFAYYIFLFNNFNGIQAFGYWNLIRFPLIPNNINDIVLIKHIAGHYLSVFGKNAYYLVLLGTPLGLFLFLKKEEYQFPVFVLFLVFLLFTASWLGFYPMLDRILVFIIPVHILVIVLVVPELIKKGKFIGFSSALLIILININVLSRLESKNVYRQKCEDKHLIEYLEKNKNGTAVYIFRRSIPQYEYYTGYSAGITKTPREPIIVGNIIYGSIFDKFLFHEAYSWDVEIDKDNLLLNVASIEKHGNVFLLMGQCPDKMQEALFKVLSRSGTVEEVKNVINTKLFLYKRRYDI